MCAAPRGKRSGVAQQQVRDGPVGEQEPQPVRPHEHLLPRAEAAGPAEPALEPERRRRARAERAVGAHGILDAHAPLERVGVVVRHLVGDHVGPHLQHARADVTRARARGRGRRVRTAPRRRCADRPAAGGGGGGGPAARPGRRRAPWPRPRGWAVERRTAAPVYRRAAPLAVTPPRPLSARDLGLRMMPPTPRARHRMRRMAATLPDLETISLRRGASTAPSCASC
jgi:hypothetical protein